MELGRDHPHLVVLDRVKLLLLDPVVLIADNFVLMDILVDFFFQRSDVVAMVVKDQLVLGQVEAKTQPFLDAFDHHAHRSRGERRFRY